MTANGKITATLVFLPLMFVVAGYLFTGRILRCSGTNAEFDSGVLQHYRLVSPASTALTLLVKNHGLWYLLLPLVSLGILILRARRREAVREATFASAWLPVMLAVLVSACFTYSAYHAFVMGFSPIVEF